MISHADLSPCKKYRYTLTRIWGWSGEPDEKQQYPHLLPYIALNPSTADAKKEDATSRRYAGFARREAYQGYVACNLYGFRSTDPKGLWSAADPIGPENDHFLKAMALNYRTIMCAWGVNARPDRVTRVVSLLRSAGARLICLGLTKDGHPRHPLMVRADQPFEEYRT